jgi:ABC-type sulfate transport system permease subunit
VGSGSLHFPWQEGGGFACRSSARSARAVGEFGAVYVVSGHIAGKTDTMPLRIEKLFQEYNLPGAFAVASVLTLLAILTLIAKTKLERKAPTIANLPEPERAPA